MVLERKKNKELAYVLGKLNRCLDVMSAFFRECGPTDLSTASFCSTLEQLISNQFLGCNLMKLSSMIQIINLKSSIK